MSKFIDKVKHKMIDNHISEKELSQMIGCQENMLNKWLSEKEEMPFMVSEHITKVLNIDNKEEELNSKFNKLNEENKTKVLKFIDFLQQNENNLILSHKSNY